MGLSHWLGREHVIEHVRRQVSDGVYKSWNFSQHDHVEAGLATYLDEARLLIEDLHSGDRNTLWLKAGIPE